jgi:hypothetical protein
LAAEPARGVEKGEGEEAMLCKFVAVCCDSVLAGCE